MLKNLKVQNYALIQNLDIAFNGDFSTLTGETGAGKSILLGALSLVLGARADSSALQTNQDKCVVEATFNIGAYQLKDFFKENDLDFEPDTLIRREITNAGKSRAFINDTPVNLQVLKELADKLIDIHSQHESLALNSSQFQLKVIDAVAKTNTLLAEYKQVYILYNSKVKQLEVLKNQAKLDAADFDYNLFQYNQISGLNLSKTDVPALEEELEILNNAEDIQQNLDICYSLLSDGEFNTQDQLKTIKQSLIKIQNFYPKAAEFLGRIESILIDIKDIAQEAEVSAGSVSYNPERALQIKEMLDRIYGAMHKHQVERPEELLALEEQFKQKVDAHSTIDLDIQTLEQSVKNKAEILQKLGNELSKKRKEASKPFIDKIKNYLVDLGMPYAGFKVDIESNSHFTADGLDKVAFLFSANKNQPEQNIAKIASGGEISRLMLSVKSILSESVSLPTIIFDEIDTGVSGEIADKMAKIMSQMAKNMQVISITHLPQIAAKGKNHYKVFKEEDDQSVKTQIVLLNKNERIDEVARMLSGSNISKEAIENAKTLIQS